MREITSPQELAELLAIEPPQACSVGQLPHDIAPPDLVLWVRPLTLEDAIRAWAAVMLEPGYGERLGYAALIAASLRVDPEALRQWPWLEPAAFAGRTTADTLAAARAEAEAARHAAEQADDDAAAALWAERLAALAEGAAPECDPARLEPLFATPSEVLAFGDPTSFDPLSGAGHAHALLLLLLEATGMVLQPAEAPASDLAGVRERLAARGRWVRGIFRADPEAAVWVRPLTEAERHESVTVARTPIGGKREATHPLAALRHSLTFALRRGPRGAALCDDALAARLPLGAARALEFEVLKLALPGVSLGGVRFRRDGAVAGAGGRGSADVVDGRVPAPPAG